MFQKGGDLNIPCPMNSYLLQRAEVDGRNSNNKISDFVVDSKCYEVTAADLVPSRARLSLFRLLYTWEIHEIITFMN